MTPLREKMIFELELQRKSPFTVRNYVAAVAELASYYGRSPDRIKREEIRQFFHYLITKRKQSANTINGKRAGVVFFYRKVLGWDNLELKIPSRRSGRLLSTRYSVCAQIVAPTLLVCEFFYSADFQAVLARFQT